MSYVNILIILWSEIFSSFDHFKCKLKVSSRSQSGREKYEGLINHILTIAFSFIIVQGLRK